MGLKFNAILYQIVFHICGKMKVNIIAILVSCFISQAVALKCYHWSDEDDFGEVIECPKEADACLKAHAEVVGTKATARSCGILGDGKDGDCIKQEDGRLGKSTVCFCTRDLCNNAPTSFNKSTFFSATVMLVLCHVFVYFR